MRWPYLRQDEPKTRRGDVLKTRLSQRCEHPGSKPAEHEPSPTLSPTDPMARAYRPYGMRLLCHQTSLTLCTPARARRTRRVLRMRIWHAEGALTQHMNGEQAHRCVRRKRTAHTASEGRGGGGKSKAQDLEAHGSGGASHALLTRTHHDVDRNLFLPFMCCVSAPSTCHMRMRSARRVRRARAGVQRVRLV